MMMIEWALIPPLTRCIAMLVKVICYLVSSCNNNNGQKVVCTVLFNLLHLPPVSSDRYFHLLYGQLEKFCHSWERITLCAFNVCKMPKSMHNMRPYIGKDYVFCLKQVFL